MVDKERMAVNGMDAVSLLKHIVYGLCGKRLSDDSSATLSSIAFDDEGNLSFSEENIPFEGLIEFDAVHSGPWFILVQSQRDEDSNWKLRLLDEYFGSNADAKPIPHKEAKALCIPGETSRKFSPAMRAAVMDA